MSRHVLKLVSALALFTLVLGAGLAHADVRSSIPTRERQAVRKAIQADARAYLRSQPFRYNRPSISVPSSSMQRLPTGGVEASASIRALGRGGAPGGPLTRLTQETATYASHPVTKQVNNISGWQRIYYAQPAR